MASVTALNPMVASQLQFILLDKGEDPNDDPESQTLNQKIYADVAMAVDTYAHKTHGWSNTLRYYLPGTVSRWERAVREISTRMKECIEEKNWILTNEEDPRAHQVTAANAYVQAEKALTQLVALSKKAASAQDSTGQVDTSSKFIKDCRLVEFNQIRDIATNVLPARPTGSESSTAHRDLAMLFGG